MHENRETSSLTVARKAVRPEKAKAAKTGMNGDEESDRGIVPMNPSNKAMGQETRTAEREEGRVRTKENIEQIHTPPAQDGQGVSQGLAGVRRVAGERKQEKFTTLLHHLTVDLLRASFQSLKRNAAPGVDGMKWQEYEEGLEDRLAD